MARRRRKSPSRRRKAPARRRQQRGFLQSPAAKSVGHALLGAGIAAAVDAVPSVSSKVANVPGGASTVTAGALVAASMVTKKASTKKMLQTAALGAAGFAVIDHLKGGDSWSVRQITSPLERTASAVIALPQQTRPSKSVEDFLANSYVDTAVA